MVTFDPLTRRVTMVQRTWPVPDSLSWARERDSVASRLDERGGQRIVCVAGVRLEHVLYNELWRFSGYDVRLLAYHLRTPETAPEWLLQVDAFADMAPECELGSLPFTASGAQNVELATAEMAACRAEKARIRTAMAAVLADFDAAAVPVPVPLLVDVDGRIRALLRDRPRYRPCESDRDFIHDPRWERMGVAPGYWGDLRYTGQLLLEVHRRDPHSPQRAYSLYSTVFGEQAEGKLAVMPDMPAALAYAKEFPDGPFIRDVYLTIAHFHKDLFMVLRDRHADFKYDCYASHISDEPWPQQQGRARSVALDYYRRVLDLDTGDDAVRTLLDETERGVVRQWSFCAD